jgi:hypothetical protein
MNTKQKIDKLWDETRQAINHTYELYEKVNENAACLRDYAENISWSDNLAALLGRETANERQHRSNRPSVSGFSNETAAKLIIMNQIEAGALLKVMPRATEFLVFRQTAAEARVIGFLIRNAITAEWRKLLATMDYSELMRQVA